MLPSVSFAASITSYPVGTCKQIQGEYWQQMPDGTWASPGDNLNTCSENGNIWNATNGLISGYGNQYSYNSQLANMGTGEWLIMCLLINSLLPQSKCQGYNPMLGNYNNYGSNNNYLQYPALGRNYIAFGGDNYNLSVETDKSGDFWKTALIGVGMGWLLDRLTS